MGLYVIAYDIASRSRLLKVHRFLKARASPIQYSVFLLNGSQEAFEECRTGLLALIDPAGDDLRCYKLPKRGAKIRLGKASLPSGIYFSGLPEDFQEDNV